MLPTWIKQPGFPIIEVSKSGDNFILSQSKFLIDGSTDESLWEIPINVRFLDTGKVHAFVHNSKKCHHPNNKRMRGLILF